MENHNSSRNNGNSDKEKNSIPNPNEVRRAGGSSTASGDRLPENDPAIINPDELASYPRQQAADDTPDIDEERKSHSVQLKSSPARDGRNITRTGPSTDTGDFM